MDTFGELMRYVLPEVRGPVEATVFLGLLAITTACSWWLLADADVLFAMDEPGELDVIERGIEVRPRID